MIAYFGDTDVRKIDTLAIEEFFEWCRTPNEVYNTSLSNNTIEKYKTHMSDLWKFMKKGKKYGVQKMLSPMPILEKSKNLRPKFLLLSRSSICCGM